MLRGVLVPLDGSQLAEQALAVGAACARRPGRMPPWPPTDAATVSRSPARTRPAADTRLGRPPGGPLLEAAARSSLGTSALEPALRVYRHADTRGLTASSLLTILDYSLPSRARRLRGLDPRLNSQAEHRAIVIHGADCVSERTITALGRLGRSQGCPALDRAVAARVIDLIRDGTVL
jgi:hypothetical protein